MEEDKKYVRFDESKWEKQEDTKFWKPSNVGDTLEGDVIAETTFEFKDGSARSFLIKTENGNEIYTPTNIVLVRRLEKIKVGDHIAIVFVQEEPPSVKGHSPTKIFDVYKRK